MSRARILPTFRIVFVIGGILGVRSAYSSASPAAQNPAGRAFEVASIKPNKSAASPTVGFPGVGRFTATNASLSE